MNEYRILKKDLESIEAPKSLFQGLELSSSLAPDNIIIFRRTDSEAFRPEGVSNNFHHRFELVIVLNGNGPVRVDDCSYELHAGEGILVFPNQFHHYLDVESENMEWLFVTFELSDSKNIEALRNSPRKVLSHSVSILQNLLRNYNEEDQYGLNAVNVSSALGKLLIDLLRSEGISEVRKDIHSSDDGRDQILKMINGYVRDHLQEGPTIGELADSLDYSVSYLRTVFRDRLGVSLGRYIRESRLSEAAKMLQSTTMSVSEVGEKVGFESLFAFSRAFKKSYGIAPKAYSKVMKDGGRAIPKAND